MNVTRGLFRLWLVISVIYLLAVAGLSYSDIKDQFDRASMDFSQAGILMVPLDCGAARGTQEADYVKSDALSGKLTCWYQVRKFRALFPRDPIADRRRDIRILLRESRYRNQRPTPVACVLQDRADRGIASDRAIRIGLAHDLGCPRIPT